MTKRAITDTEAEQLLAGTTPEGRPDLAVLAASIAGARAVSTAADPQPSVALAARLDSPVPVGARVETQPARGIKKMVASLAGLGIAAKIAAGSGALALGLVGMAGAAGAVGALPGPAQDVFDGVFTTIVTDDENTVEEGGQGAGDECVVDDAPVTDQTTGAESEPITCSDALPVGSKQFSEWVRDGAQDPNKIGSEFGESVSEQARELKDEKAEERAANPNNPNGNNGRFGAPATGDDSDEQAQPTQPGKPEGTPGGRP